MDESAALLNNYSAGPFSDGLFCRPIRRRRIIVLLEQSQIVLFCRSRIAIQKTDGTKFHLVELFCASEKFLNVAAPLQSSGERWHYNRTRKRIGDVVMKKILQTSVALIVLLASPVMAADIAVKAPPPTPVPPPVFSWTGCYLGGHVGG